MVPVKKLLPNKSSFKLVNSINSNGMVPVKLLLYNLSVSKFLSCPNSAGMVPSNLFMKSSKDFNSFKFLIVEGRVPLSLLNPKFNFLNDTKSPISCGN